MNNTKKRIPMHVFILLVFFWPVGLFLLYRHLTEDKTNLMRNSQIMRNFGIGFVICGAIAIIGSQGDISYIMVTLLFIAGGVLMIYQSNQLKLRANTYRHYIDLVVNNAIDSLPKISDAMQLPYQTVEADLQKMIEIGIFANAYLDRQARRIILPAKNVDITRPSQTAPGFTNAAFSPAPQPSALLTAAAARVYKCKYCGANNVIEPGAIKQCEYCGSPL